MSLTEVKLCKFSILMLIPENIKIPDNYKIITNTISNFSLAKFAVGENLPYPTVVIVVVTK